MTRFLLAFASFSGGVGVLLGAFAAHGLKAQLSDTNLNVFETGVRYQMLHALALFAVSWLWIRHGHGLTRSAGIAFVMGTVLFSGSLYLLACRELLGIAHWKWLGPITPLGGVAFLVGWILLGISVLKIKDL
jgi:uncharacterized membrane protein YgdD (TMEM256/DUF423 family)